MDAARALEQRVLARQQPMNAVIDRGDSAVQQFYSGAAVFVTGGSGFLGKQLIEKLFRSCAIKKIYVLLRPKKGNTIQDRLEYMLNDPVYDVLRQKQPSFAEKIVPVEGDVADVRLGISDKDWCTITQEVDIIFHMAATVRFDAPIRAATFTNVRSTREAVTLARDCKKLKCFVHVSTAYTHATTSRIDTELKEEFYSCPIPPDVMIQMAESIEEERLNDMTPQMIKDWPNTYTFTKAIAEEVIRTTAADLPVCIVKPPAVLPAYYEPCPGWADLSVLFGPCGILIGVGLGVLHVFYTKTNKKLNMVPVDFVNNAIIATAWDAMSRPKEKNIPIYTISSSKLTLVWDLLGCIFRKDESKKLSTPKAVWYCYLIETDNKAIYWFLTWFLHYIPAYIFDLMCQILRIKIKGVPSFRKHYEKIYKLSKVFSHFLTNEWYFNDDNLSKMITRMSDADKAIFNCDVFTINYTEYIRVISVGLRKYIVKDGLVDSEKAYKKQKWLKYVNIIFFVIYISVLFMIINYSFKTIKYIVY